MVTLLERRVGDRRVVGYAAPMTGPKTDPAPPERSDAACQPDLFDRRGDDNVRPLPEGAIRSSAAAPRQLSDGDLAEKVAKAGPSDIDALCAEIVARSLSAAVPALEGLWRRFHGFGTDRPFREQCAVLETLARLRGPGARAALRRIVLSPGLSASLLPATLRASADAGLSLPASFVAGYLGHGDAAVRGAAFDLAPGANVPAPRLREGLSDGVASIRRAAAVALAHRGDAAGRDVLIAAFARTPSMVDVEALAAIGDDEAIVELGRCATRHSAIAPDIIAMLRDLGSPRANRLAARLEAGLVRSSTGRAP